VRSWQSPAVPALTGRGPGLRLFDTATHSLLAPADNVDVGMYVCGITPYDATHLGHAATYLAYDIALRVLVDDGHRVHYVQNVTDVDEPLLERAARDGEDWQHLAERQIQLFREDMAALRVCAPDELVGAVEAIPVIAEMIGRLAELGAVYEVAGDRYFAVAADPAFGTESGLDRASMERLFGENGGDPDRPSKKDALDPVLWRAERPGEPSWDGPLGRGRPGWHIECAAIALAHLGSFTAGGTSIAIQGGGRDLVFPHHEMSASHARVVTGEEFARVYSHAGMIGLDGEKMSKSRGNLVLVSELRARGVDPAAIRLGLLSGHYRADRDWTDAVLDDATARLARWRVAAGVAGGPVSRAAAGGASSGGAASGGHVPGGVVTALRERLADDLDTAGALAIVDTWAAGVAHGEAGTAGAPESNASEFNASEVAASQVAAAEVVRAVDALLGITLS